MSRFTFELRGFVEWTDNGLQDKILYASRFDRQGKPKMLSRVPPTLLRGSDGTLWFEMKGRVVRLRGPASGDPFLLTAAGIDNFLAIAPTQDRGMVVLGCQDEETVLARLGADGQAIWRRTDHPALQEHLVQAQLLGDADGSLFLYATTARSSQVLAINSDDGTVSRVAGFDSPPPQRVWVRQGSLFWVANQEDGLGDWICRDLKTGSLRTVSPPSLRHLLYYIQGPLPQGGALLAIPQNGELIWMGSEGQEVGRLELAGLVREGDRLFAGTRGEGLTRLSSWQEGRELGSWNIPPLGDFGRLIAADRNGFLILDSRKLIALDAAAKPLNEVPLLQVAEERARREGTIGIGRAVVEPSGSVLVPGADPEGAYVARITLVP
jgi:hypothetical protein